MIAAHSSAGANGAMIIAQPPINTPSASNTAVCSHN
jgi:hypothetical protein